MKTLTASQATALLIEKMNYNIKSFETYYIEDNAYTEKFGRTDFEYVNPQHNDFNPALAYWTAKGTRFSILIYELNGKSNVTLEMWNGTAGKTVANYNKMKAAEKREFIEMCLNSKRVYFNPPFEIWEGWKDESYRDEKGIFHIAWRTPDGNLHNSK